MNSILLQSLRETIYSLKNAVRDILHPIKRIDTKLELLNNQLVLINKTNEKILQELQKRY